VQIVDYESLTQSITDYTHRPDLVANLYADYFIQLAQTKLAKDIIRLNFGNGIQAMEVAMQPVQIQGGTAPVPSDWFTPKTLQVQDGSGDVFTLIFKAAAWIYDEYPIRQPDGLPAYIARDVMPACVFTGFISENQLTVQSITSGALQVGMLIDDVTGFIPNPCSIIAFGTGTGGIGTYTISQSTLINVEGMTGGGNVFIFGPYPDSSYTIQGTYYSKGTPLSSASPTNWMVLQTPEALHAGCMIEAGKFLKDATMVQTWTPIYEDFVESIVDQDKGERFASSTMQIETG
jgi:hypothetical protein